MNPNVAELIAHPEKLADRTVVHELKELIATYPYFQNLRLLYLKGLYLLRDASFGEELCRTALLVPDRRVLFSLIEGEHYALRPVVRKAKRVATGDEAPADRTQLLIDAFLSGLPPEPEEEFAEPLLTDDDGLSADYTTYVLSEESLLADDEEETASIPPMKGQHLIDNFIKKADESITQETEGTAETAPAQETDELHEIDEDDGFFTETLAKIYIKQQRYGKALEIIRRLSLKYPKKNAYFADQIRFLEKLVQNNNDK